MIRSIEFDEFYNSLPVKVQNKVKYAMNIIADVKVVNTKLVKKLASDTSFERFYKEVYQGLQEGDKKSRTNFK